MPLEPVAQALQDSIQKGNYKKALGFCDKKLELDPNNEAVKTTKLLCFIQESRYEDALNYMQELSTDLQQKLITEKIYSLYKLRKHEEALDALSKISTLTTAQLHLQAQTYYRMGNYSKCTSILESIRSSEDTPELMVNMAASNCLGNTFNSAVRDAHKENKNSYELAFNASCIYIQRNELETAEEQLKLADKIGREILPQQEYTESEIEDELAGVQAQLAFIYQMTNREAEAIEIYEKILKNKPSDASVAAVASNNVVTLHKDHKLFNAEKNLFNAISAADDHKLTKKQEKLINFNRAVVYLKMGKVDKCREVITTLTKDYPDSPLPALIQAALLLKEKQSTEAENLLKEKAEQGNIATKLTLAQLLLKDGKTQECIDSLQSLGEDSYRLGVVSTCVRLYQQMKAPEKAYSLLNDAIKHWTEKGDQETLEKMKAASSYVDNITQQAKKLSEEDIEKLENVTAHRAARETEVEEQTDSSQVVERKKKKKKKKKKRLPKNYDPNVEPDPERWLPRNQRSSFKKRRKKMRGGHQGGVSDSTPTNDAPTTNTTASATPKKQPKKQQKKKKKGGLR